MFWREQVADVFERIAESAEGSGGLFSQQRLEFGEGHLNRVEIGRVGGQVQEPGTTLSHQFCDPLALVEGDVVENDDVASSQFGDELGLDIGLEAGLVHRRVDEPGRHHAVTAQAGDEGLRLPPAEWGVSAEARAPGRPSRALGQTGVCRCLIDEDQAAQCLGKEASAPLDPVLTRLGDVGTSLLFGL